MSAFLIPDNFVQRGDCKQEDLAVHAIDLTRLRTFDALQTNLPGTAADDDMALVTGTPGTAAPVLQGVDFGGASTDECAGFIFPLPLEYVAGESIVLRITAGMLTTVSDGTATVDVNAWQDDGDGTVSSDACATAAQSINSLTLANKDFVITPTGVAAGDLLNFKIAFGGSDSGNAGVMIPTITKLAVLLDIRG